MGACQNSPAIGQRKAKMAKKQYFAIVDTETTVNDTVADFGIVICDRKGQIVKQCAVMVQGHFDKMDLFYDPKDNGFWGKIAAEKRKADYLVMLQDGRRMAASVGAINNWIAKAIGQYDPILTAYNLPFDLGKCVNTGIDLTGFRDKFCLWAASVGNICKTKHYRQFCLENHLFNNPTEYRNMTYKTNAEAVAGFIAGTFVEEPHTAIEDAVYFELPILKYILKKRDWKDKIQPFNWREFQVKDSFTAK